MTDKVILGVPFMCLLYPFTIDSEGITTHPFRQPVKFSFLRSPEPREINVLQYISISKTLNLINKKIQHLQYLKDDLNYRKIEEQLENKTLIKRIALFEENSNKKFVQTSLQPFGIGKDMSSPFLMSKILRKKKSQPKVDLSK